LGTNYIADNLKGIFRNENPFFYLPINFQSWIISTKKKHIEKWNKAAPYWAVLFVVFTLTGLSTTWIDLGDFWKGYVLDITGPAWNYILFRNRFTAKSNNRWTRFFTPLTTVLIFSLVCIGIESAQYFELYDSTYDPWDFVAYFSLLIPLFLIDFLTSQERD